MHRYAEEAAALAEEFAESLTDQDVARLRARLQGWTRRDWLRWRQQNWDRIRQYVRATPAQQRARKGWREDALLLTLGAYQHCAQGAAVMTAMLHHDLTPGGSYRHTAARAGDAFRAILEEALDVPDWPWDHDPPFAD